MKKLSAYLFLILLSFSAPSFAADISDFEIDGISVGDSLLDYMSEQEIKENVVFVYEDKKFTISESNKSSEMYDGVGITYKANDKTYKIHGVQGLIDFPDNIGSCYKKQDEIEKDISSLFSEAKKKNWGILINPNQAEGSTYKPITFDLNKGGNILIACHHYSDTPQIDHLKISIKSKEYKEYTLTDAVKADN